NFKAIKYFGLYVAKEFIKKHNGRLWTESAGEGKARPTGCHSGRVAPSSWNCRGGRRGGEIIYEKTHHYCYI
ncbi:hypothetical protein COU58_02000, partial [Candidatus Pacearchaeota archaeon CG10_big_fil_rev_8_21_14_0_10_32_42]